MIDNVGLWTPINYSYIAGIMNQQTSLGGTTLCLSNKSKSLEAICAYKFSYASLAIINKGQDLSMGISGP